MQRDLESSVGAERLGATIAFAPSLLVLEGCIWALRPQAVPAGDEVTAVLLQAPRLVPLHKAHVAYARRLPGAGTGMVRLHRSLCLGQGPLHARGMETHLCGAGHVQVAQGPHQGLP